MSCRFQLGSREANRSQTTTKADIKHQIAIEEPFRLVLVLSSGFTGIVLKPVTIYNTCDLFRFQYCFNCCNVTCEHNAVTNSSTTINNQQSTRHARDIDYRFHVSRPSRNVVQGPDVLSE